jgi:AcrR family transcriptional regulator
MAPRQDVSEQRRHQIMDAAFAVFSRLGFERASMDDIAKEAGVSKGALYLYYKSKDAIIGRLLQVFFDQALKQVRSLAATEGSVTRHQMTLTHQMVREMDRMASLQPVSLQLYAVAARHAVIRQHLRAYFAEYRTVMEALIQRGIAQGEFRPDINSAEVAITLSGLLEGLALLWMIDPQATNWHEQVETSTRLLLRGVVIDPATIL